MAMLEVTNLCKRYEGFSLGPVNLRLEPGTAHGLIGPNGAGKTTIFRCIMGTVRRDQGLLRVAGHLADSASGGWKTSIGYVGDYTPLFDHLSGTRNLQLHSDYYDDWSHETAQTLASRLELDLGRAVKRYSTGQRTKLALVLALAHHPQMLLLDEPATGLDPVVRTVFLDVLYECMQDERFTLLYATHHISEIEPLADQLIFLDSGQVLRHEVKADLVQSWRRITFRVADDPGTAPGQVSAVRQGRDHEVISSDYQDTVRFLEQAGVESVLTTQMSTEEICVHILKNHLEG